MMDLKIIADLSKDVGELRADMKSVKGDITEIKDFVLGQKLRWAKLTGIVIACSTLASFIGWLISAFHK